MARSVARLKMGFYPLPVSEGANLRQLLSFTGPASVVDPCVGQGVALNLITQGADVRRYGVELDAERALAASATGIETIQGNTFDAVAKPESFSLLYLNPPYDSEIGSIGKQPHGAPVSGTHLPLAGDGGRAGVGHPVRAPA